MKGIVFLLVLLLSPWVSGQSLADGRKKYDGADYNGAAAAFAKALEASPRDPALHYDLGNALFKGGHLGRAIASYQRAFDIEPRDSDIRYNLTFALKRAGEELRPEGTPPAVFYVFTILSERELAGLHWLFCWAAMLIACAYVLKPEKREDLFLPLACAGLLWVGAGLWWGGRSLLEPEDRGVIVKSTAELRSGPGDNFNVSFTAPEGRRVQILSNSGGWLEIGISKEGARGWVPSEAVEKI